MAHTDKEMLELYTAKVAGKTIQRKDSMNWNDVELLWAGGTYRIKPETLQEAADSSYTGDAYKRAFKDGARWAKANQEE